MEIKVYCKDCGGSLKSNLNPSTENLELVIEPCADCLEKARMSGWDEGSESGYTEAVGSDS